MGEIKLDTEAFRTIAIFERVTKVHPRDCLMGEDCVYFLIDPEKMALAIGKAGATINEFKKVFGKPVKLFEYSDDPAKMVKNFMPSAENIEIDDNGVKVSIPANERSAVIGKAGKNIKIIKEFLLRHFDIKNVRLR